MNSEASIPTGELPESDDIRRLQVHGREIVLIGTAHVSQESADLVRKVISEERPDRVCVELDERRYEALSNPDRWKALDLKELIRKRQLATLLINLLLASYQKRLGGKLGVVPGTELLEAIQAAEEQDIPISLCDRDVRITLRRAWRSLPWYRKLWLVASLLSGVFDEEEISEEKLRELRQRDVLNGLMKELGEAMPELKIALIDERDDYLAEKIVASEGRRVVAVVGAGHLEGICRVLQEGERRDLEELERVHEVSRIWAFMGWAIPALIIGAVLYIGWSQGASAAGDNALYWILANGIPCAIGTAIALGHPLTILAAFVAAPITSLTPVIGAAYVVAFVQVWVRPPVVAEIQSVADDISIVSAWWRNRLLRILLAFILSGMGSMLGSFVGGFEILSNLGVMGFN